MSERHDIVRGVVDEPARPTHKAFKVPIAFPEYLYEWLRETAYVRRVSMARVVREAVAAYQAHEQPGADRER